MRQRIVELADAPGNRRIAVSSKKEEAEASSQLPFGLLKPNVVSLTVSLEQQLQAQLHGSGATGSE